jgi:hypothetical protein
MSKHDYSVIRATKLCDFKSLPDELKKRFLSTCPRSVRTALSKII